MTEPITINALLQLGGIIAAFWGGYKILMEIIKTISEKFTAKQKEKDENNKMTERYDKAIELVV